MVLGQEINAEKSKKANASILYRMLSVLFVAILGALTFGAAFRASGTVGTDYYFHAQWATTISFHHLNTFFDTYHVYYPMWHFMVFVLYRIGVEVSVAGGLVTAILNIITFLGVLYYMNMAHVLDKLKNLFVSFGLMLAGPIWLGFAYTLAVGHCSPNEWRNPTTLAARTLAVFIFIMISKILDERKNATTKDWITLSILLAVSALAKPSFLQAFIPGLGIYLVFRCLKIRSAANIRLFGKIVLTHIPAVAILCVQALLMLGEGIDISWFEYWKQHTGSVVLSLCAAFLFPVFVLLAYGKGKSEDVTVILPIQISAFLEAALLVEKGSRRLHGNFVWANSIAMFLFYMVMARVFMHEISEKERMGNSRYIWKQVLGYCLFFLHLAGGLWWLFAYII